MSEKMQPFLLRHHKHGTPLRGEEPTAIRVPEHPRISADEDFTAVLPAKPPSPAIESVLAGDEDFFPMYFNELLPWLNEGGGLSPHLRTQLRELLTKTRGVIPTASREASPVAIHRKPSTKEGHRADFYAHKLLGLLRKGFIPQPGMREMLISALAGSS